jgi:tetratricopeptide (TPR) repeat protein
MSYITFHIRKNNTCIFRYTQQCVDIRKIDNEVTMYFVLTALVLLFSTSVLIADDAEKPDSTGKATEAILQAHHFFAVDCNNETWKLMEKANFTADEKDALLQTAFASAYHWKQVGTGINFQRAEWLLARVYTVLGNKQEALAHALRCLDLTSQYLHEMQDFDHAYAYEGAARAYALNKDNLNWQKYYEKAEQAAAKIAVQEDKDLFVSDLSGGNWFGMK